MPKFLNDLEWVALSNSGSARKVIEDLRAQVATLTTEKNDLLAQLRDLRAARSNPLPIPLPTTPVPSPRAPAIAPPVIEKTKSSEETEDDMSQRYRMLELD